MGSGSGVVVHARLVLPAAFLLAAVLSLCLVTFPAVPSHADAGSAETVSEAPSPHRPGKPLVAVIDTGCDPSLCEDAVSVIDGDPANVDGHGTSVARMVLGQDPDARILSIRALDDEDGASAEDVCAALRYAIDHGADIINMSFSSYMPDGCPEIEQLVAEATEARIAVVCSAGNKGYDASGYCPAQIDAAITVGCLDLNGEPSSSSNYGEGVDVWLVSASTSYSTAMASGRLSLMGRPADGDWLSELIAYGDIDVQETVPVLDENGDEISEGEAGFNPDFTHAALTSRVHISYIGDSNWMTTNESYPTATANKSMTSNSYGVHPQNNLWSHIENMAFKVTQNNAASGGITYRCYYRNTGYDSWRSNGAYSPASTGNGMSVEGLDAKLTGTLASCYNLNYKVYTSAQYEYDQTVAIPSSDSSKYPYVHKWYSASNGGYAGTQGKGVGIEGYRMWLTPKSYTHTVQVRYQNADGSYTGWSNARSGSYAYGSTVPVWNRALDDTYNAASMAAYTAGYANNTVQVSVTRRTASNVIRARYQNADGSWGAYSDKVNGTYRVGQTVSWSSPQDATYSAASASYTATAAAQTKSVDIARKTASVTFRYRLQNADGSWPSSYTAGRTDSGVRVGQTVSFTTAADPSVYSNKTKSGTVAAAPSATAAPADVTVSIDVPRTSFSATFDANGGTVDGKGEHAVSIDRGSRITAPTPSNPGHHLVCWVPVKNDDEKWVEVLYQEPDTAYFANDAGARAKNAAGAYSCIGQMPELRRGGVYEFLQTADEKPGQYNRWRQSNDITQASPAADAASAEGFEEVSLSWGAGSFKGLVNKSSQGSALAAYACGNAGYWWHAVGQFAVYQGGNPWIADGSFVATSPIHLYVLSDESLSNIGAGFDSGIGAGGDVFGKYENQRFKALWEANAYTVRYNANGGTGEMPESSFTYGEPAALRPCSFSAPDHFAFAGWATSPEDAAAGIVTRADGADHADLTDADGGVVELYAVWDGIEHGGFEDDESNPDADGDGLGDNIALSAPTDIAFVSKPDGSLLTPGNAVIRNHSAFDIKVSSVSVEIENGWAFAPAGDFDAASARNTLSMTFGPGGDELDVTDFLDGKGSVGTSGAWKVHAGGQIPISFRARAKNLEAMSSVFGEIHWYVKAAS